MQQKKKQKKSPDDLKCVLLIHVNSLKTIKVYWEVFNIFEEIHVYSYCTHVVIGEPQITNE